MTCGCGIQTVNGQPPSGGGSVTAYECVYEVDWRDAFADLGAVDLNSPGATLVYDGITWTTPTIANSGANQVSATNSWSLTAGGLAIDSPNGGSLAGNQQSWPHIFAELADIAANSATPFEADPTRRYLLQVFVADSTPVANADSSGVGLYKQNGVPAGGFSATWVAFGFNAATASIPTATAGNTGSPPTLNRTDLVPVGDIEYRVPTILYANSGKTIDCHAAPVDLSEAFAWPANGSFRFIGGYAENLEFDNDVPGDPVEGWRVCIGHTGNAGSAYRGNIERFRICQF